MRKMGEELNVELLSKIRFWENAELFGKVFCCVWLLVIVLYFIIEKVYMPLRYMTKENNLNLKKRRTKKNRFCILLIISSGIIGIWVCSINFVEADSIAKGTIESTTEKIREYVTRENTERVTGEPVRENTEKITGKSIEQATKEIIEESTGQTAEETTIESAEESTEGIEEEVVDDTATEISVYYTDVLNILEEEASPINVNKKIQTTGSKVTSSQNEIISGRENEMTIRIREKNMDPNAIQIEMYCIKYGASGKTEQRKLTEKEIKDKIIKKEMETTETESEAEETFLYSVKNLQDGHYKVMVHCKDKAGNMMAAEKGSETDCCMHAGWYESPLYTIDTVPPVITEVVCNQKPVKKIGERQYFQNSPQIIIKVQEENFNKSNFSVNGKMFLASGKTMNKEWQQWQKRVDNLQWKSYYSDGIRVNEAGIAADVQANYFMNFQSADEATYKGNQRSLEITYDNEKPQIIYTGEDNEKEDFVFRPEISLKDKYGLFIFHRYSFFRYFSKERICASIRVQDEVSGVEKINYMFIPYESTEKNTGEMEQERKGEWPASQNVKTAENVKSEKIENQDKSELAVIALPEQKNFKGYLKVYGQDYAGNTGDVIKSKGSISEDEKLHKKESDISIKMPAPVFTDKDKNISYYNKTVLVDADFEDRQSGIYKTVLSGEINAESEMGNENTVKKQSGNIAVWNAEDIVYQKRQRILLEAEKFYQSDAAQPVIIQGLLTDNAGHVSKECYGKKVVIDTTKPEIKVDYDKNNETGYYNSSRKATVTIKERNFTPDLVKWDIRGSNQKYRIGEWKSEQEKYTDGKTTRDKHVCEIYFDEDGEDYSVNLSVSDYAGNKSEWKDRTYFTIDKQAPELSVRLEGVAEKNVETVMDDFKENAKEMYFNTPKTVVLCIQDKNFDQDKVEYDIKAVDGEKEIKIKNAEKYIKEGDKYYNKIILEKEGQYYIQAKCTDKAGNESEKKKISFVIDTTEPKITVKGVENDFTYDEKVIMPEVICADKYLEADSVTIHLIKINGEPVPKEEWNYERIDEKAKVHVQWGNLDSRKQNDGIYQLLIQAEDKAGNRTKNNFKILFRVNRWGADFILGKELKEKIDGHYLKEIPKIRLKEQCVKKTKSKVIILKDNEERREPEKSDIKERIIADKKSARYGWYEKDYNISKDNFTEEGDYRVTFKSDQKGKVIHFVVDKTAPVISINNLENEVYEEKEHEFTLNIMDNYAFDKMELYIEKKPMKREKNTNQKVIIKPEDLDENHMYRQTLAESEEYQTIRYIAWDKAGNKIDSDENGETKRCLVTHNKAIKELDQNRNNYVQAVIAGIIICAVVSVTAYMVIRYRKRRE